MYKNTLLAYVVLSVNLLNVLVGLPMKWKKAMQKKPQFLVFDDTYNTNQLPNT